MGCSSFMLIGPNHKEFHMNAVWVGLSVSLLAGIIQVASIGEGGQLNGVKINQLPDGDLVINQGDGSTLVLPKNITELIKKLNLSDSPRLAGGLPCVAKSV